MRTAAARSSAWNELREALRNPDLLSSMNYWVRKRKECRAYVFWGVIILLASIPSYYLMFKVLVYIIPSLGWPSLSHMQSVCMQALVTREAEARVCGLALPLSAFPPPPLSVTDHDPDFSIYCDHGGNFFPWPRIDYLYQSPTLDTIETFEQCMCPDEESYQCPRTRYNQVNLRFVNEQMQTVQVLLTHQMQAFCLQHLVEVASPLFKCHTNINCCGGAAYCCCCCCKRLAAAEGCFLRFFLGRAGTAAARFRFCLGRNGTGSLSRTKPGEYLRAN
mgnify:CR=1 FL=1